MTPSAKFRGWSGIAGASMTMSANGSSLDPFGPMMWRVLVHACKCAFFFLK